jgi:hypothetical protein
MVARPCCKKIVGEHTQRCKDYRRQYYLKNKEKIQVQIKNLQKDYRPSKDKLKKSYLKHKKYYQLYSKYYYLKKVLENPN